MGESYNVNKARTTPLLPPEARGRWRIYPVHGVTDSGICRCRKGPACSHPGKHPAVPNGVHDATSDPLEIAEMFAARPGYGFGLATGVRSGVAVLDSDEYEGGGSSRRLLQEIHGPLPGTRMHQSGSGALHELFAIPVGTEHLPSRTLAPGLELKADGAGVVLPPSRTNRGTYEVLIEGPLLTLPSWIVDLATGLSVIEGGGDGATRSRYQLPRKIWEGTRSKILYRYGCSLRAHGWEHDAIFEELLRVNAERCAPPQDDSEVTKAARSAARHPKGSASPEATPEVLEALADVEATVLSRPWPRVGGKSERSVMIALILAGRLHGSLIPAGVRVSIATRPLAETAGMSHRSLMRAVHRLRLSGMIRRDDRDRGIAEAGAFVLVRSPASPARANRHHSATPPVLLRSTERVNDDTLRAPRLRWGWSLGKGCEQAVDVLEGAGGEMGLEALAKALGVKRVRDLRRRVVSRLEDAKVVRVVDETVRLRDGWLEALREEKMRTGEKKAENLDRSEHERQREAFRRHVAERRGEEGG